MAVRIRPQSSYSTFQASGQVSTVLDEFPSEVIQLIFMQCVASSDIKGFVALGLTNVHTWTVMQKLVNEIALTTLCPKLRILDARTHTFHADLIGIDKYNALQSYYKLEPFVEDHEGFTIIFNQGGLTFKDMKENHWGIIVQVLNDRISEELDNVPEEDTGPEMISNAPITETRGRSPESQETRVSEEVGFDGKPTLIPYLVLLIATQKELGICLYGEGPKKTYGRTSTRFEGRSLLVRDFIPGRLTIDCPNGWDYPCSSAGGRWKL